MDLTFTTLLENFNQNLLKQGLGVLNFPAPSQLVKRSNSFIIYFGTASTLSDRRLVINTRKEHTTVESFLYLGLFGIIHRDARFGPARASFDSKGICEFFCYRENGVLHRPKELGPAYYKKLSRTQSDVLYFEYGKQLNQDGQK